MLAHTSRALVQSAARAAPFSAAVAASSELLRVNAVPTLAPTDVQLGCIWLSGLIDRGVDSLDVDPGQEQANALVAAALAAGIVDFDTAPLYGASPNHRTLALRQTVSSGDCFWIGQGP